MTTPTRGRAATRPATSGVDGRLGEDLGLTPERPARDVPADLAHAGARRADVDPQSGGQGALRHLRPGPRGRAGRHLQRPAARARLDGPVLPFGGGLPDLRHDAARDHARPVRARRRPELGRPPDARPLRRRAAQHHVPVVARRDPGPACRRHRPGGQDPGHRPGRHHRARRGRQQPGRLPRGAQLRGHPQAAGRLSSSRTTATPSASRRRLQRAVEDIAVAGRGLRHARHHRRRRRRARLLSRRSRGDRPSAARRRADAHRGQGHPADGALVGRPADEVPAARRTSRRAGSTTRCRASGASCGTAGILDDETEAAHGGRGQAGGRGRHRLGRGPARARPGDGRAPRLSSSRGPEPGAMRHPRRCVETRSARPWPTRCGATRR